MSTYKGMIFFPQTLTLKLQVYSVSVSASGVYSYDIGQLSG